MVDNEALYQTLLELVVRTVLQCSVACMLYKCYILIIHCASARKL